MTSKRKLTLPDNRNHKKGGSKKSSEPYLNLCIATTSTPSKRLFSEAGNTMTAKRTKLNTLLFERIVFLKKKYAMY